MKKIHLLVFVSLTLSAQTFSQSYVPEWNDKRIKVKSAADIKAYAFNISDVKLLPELLQKP